MKRDNRIITLSELQKRYIVEASKLPWSAVGYEEDHQNKSKLKRLRLTMDEIMKEIEKE